MVAQSVVTHELVAKKIGHRLPQPHRNDWIFNLRHVIVVCFGVPVLRIVLRIRCHRNPLSQVVRQLLWLQLVFFATHVQQLLLSTIEIRREVHPAVGRQGRRVDSIPARVKIRLDAEHRAAPSPRIAITLGSHLKGRGFRHQESSQMEARSEAPILSTASVRYLWALISKSTISGFHVKITHRSARQRATDGALAMGTATDDNRPDTRPDSVVFV
ncbi:hypothetical protein FB451DRAFT_1171998 [Mycena latifolia]|nr:hypothetical protein FB451DRAFT_1171998 [Mycena latifolia]